MKDANVIVRYCNIDQKQAKIIGFSLVCGERVLDDRHLPSEFGHGGRLRWNFKTCLTHPGIRIINAYTSIKLAFASVHVRRHD